MKYVSIDVEATSLVPAPQHLLMLALVIEDTTIQLPIEDLPSFVRVIDPGEIVIGQPKALAMNAWLLEMIDGHRRGARQKYAVASLSDAVFEARCFLDEHLGSGRHFFAGKNAAGFDLQFLPVPLKDRAKHRVIDPGSVFIDWQKGPPALGHLLETLDRPVQHDALEDARDVVRVLRRSYSRGRG